MIVMTLKTFEMEKHKLDELVEASAPGGVFENRLLFHVLSQIQTMGYAWRDEWSVVLYHGDHEGLTSDAYSEYLDRKASNEKVWFDPDANDGKGEVLFTEPVIEEE